MPSNKYARRRYNRRKSNKKYNTKRTYVSKKSAPVTMSGVKKLIKNQILKTAESKFVNVTFGKTELYHNTLHGALINDTTCMPSQGLGDGYRIGDEIQVGGFYLRMLCGQKYDRPNCTWKHFVIKVPKGASVTYATIFDNTIGNVLLDNVNKDKAQVLYQKVSKPRTGSLLVDNGDSNYALQSKEFTFPLKIWIPYRKIYKFQADAGTAHTDGDIYLITLVYDAYGTLQSDNLAYQQLTTTMYFKDP